MHKIGALPKLSNTQGRMRFVAIVAITALLLNNVLGAALFATRIDASAEFADVSVEAAEENSDAESAVSEPATDNNAEATTETEEPVADTEESVADDSSSNEEESSEEASEESAETPADEPTETETEDESVETGEEEAEATTPSVLPPTDATDPVVTITTPVMDEVVDQGFMVTGNAVDLDSGVETVTVEIAPSVGGSNVFEGEAAYNDTDNTFTITIPNGTLDAGLDYDVLVTATDGAGNTGDETVEGISGLGLYDLALDDDSISTVLKLGVSLDCTFINDLISSYTSSTISPLDLTVFAPQNDAFSTLPMNELNELDFNADELCEVLAHHVHVGDILESSDLNDGDMISTESGDGNVDVSIDGTTVMIDQTTVVDADNLAVDGVYHVIDGVLLPQNTLATIDELATNSTSPEVTGTWSLPAAITAEYTTADVCILVRVDGTPYQATTNMDGTWSIAEGTINIDPLAGDTLFSVVSRYCETDLEAGSARLAMTGTTFGSELIALTMTDDVITYMMPVDDDEEDTGAVLGTTTTVSEPTPVAVASTPAVASCGKATSCDGSFGGSGLDADAANEGDDASSADDADVEGSDADGDSDDGDGDSSTSPIWWLLGGASVVGIWYVLWRRESN